MKGNKPAKICEEKSTSLTQLVLSSVSILCSCSGTTATSAFVRRMLIGPEPSDQYCMKRQRSMLRLPKSGGSPSEPTLRGPGKPPGRKSPKNVEKITKLPFPVPEIRENYRRITPQNCVFGVILPFFGGQFRHFRGSDQGGECCKFAPFFGVALRAL